jgi:hypothetical protein
MLSTAEPAKQTAAPESRYWAGSPPLLYAVVAAHVVVLALTSSGKWGDAASSFVQLVAGALAAAACWQASRRSRYFATIFWRLSAATFGLWTFGALLNTVQNLRSTTPDEDQIGVFLLIFLSTAPMFIGSVLSGTADEESKIHWDLILDATQILVLVLAIHLMLVDIPSMTIGESRAIHMGLRLQDYWRVALAIALVGRGLLDHSPATRRLIKPIAIAMSLFAVGSWIGNDLEAFSGWKGARWFDLAWTIPFVMVAFSAASWRQPPTTPAWDRKPMKVEAVFLF